MTRRRRREYKECKLCFPEGWGGRRGGWARRPRRAACRCGMWSGRMRGGSLLPGVVLTLSGAGDICELQPWGRHAAQLIRLRPQSKCSAFTLLQFVLIASFSVHERASGPGRRSQVRVHEPTEMATCYWSEAETPVSVRDASCPSPMRHPRGATKAIQPHPRGHLGGLRRTWRHAAAAGRAPAPRTSSRSTAS